VVLLLYKSIGKEKINLPRINKKQRVINQITENLKQKEKEIAINAAMGGYYSAIKIVQDMITRGKNIAGLSTFCAAELSKKEIVEQGTKSNYLKSNKEIKGGKISN
jgi:hypothetical protein